MKPTKNRVFCNDCKKFKMLFETEKKADTFIKFNKDVIEEETGYAPDRSYYCVLCAGWHVTSHEDSLFYKHKNELIITKLEENKKSIKSQKLRNNSIKQISYQKRDVHIRKVQNYIQEIEKSIAEQGNSQNKIHLANAYEELFNAKAYSGANKLIKSLEQKLIELSDFINS